jgi:hypothetical protein
MAVGMKRRRGSEDDSLAIDLTDRLAAYTRTDGIHCHGCGARIAEIQSEVAHWGWDRRRVSGGSGPYPYCERCARLGMVAR